MYRPLIFAFGRAKILELISEHLKKFPFIWKLAVMFYGARSFKPNNAEYHRNSRPLHENLIPNITCEVVFDAQCLQTKSLTRGIGKYSLKFIEATCNARPNKSFAAVLTTVASSTDLASAQLALENLDCANLNIMILDPFDGKKKVSMVEGQQNLLRDLEKIVCNSVISLSSFQKPDSVIALPTQKSSKFSKVAILYDLIPLQFSKSMLISNWQKTSYKWALNNLANFDLLLSISQESREHWSKLVTSRSRVEVIRGGIDLKSTSEQKKFDERSGILCVGAEQRHKNVAMLINAYSQLPENVQLEHKLTILGISSAAGKKRFSKIARAAFGKVEFSAYLDEALLTSAYENARLLVMPSLVEGLSLPILEAWSSGLLAIGGVNTVAEELIADHSLLFDPTSAPSMAECMKRLLNSKVDWNRGLESSMLRSKEFTWGATAELALEAIGAIKHD
jgi:glycosyltransferase involved in cell wall biosynthesis